MKFINTFALCLVAALITYQAFAGPDEEEIETMENRLEWVAQCLKDFQTLKPGMTRSEVRKKFPVDGGITAGGQSRLTHPSCRFFKVDVDFKCKTDDEGRALVGDDDLSIKISKPYIETPYFD